MRIAGNGLLVVSLAFWIASLFTVEACAADPWPQRPVKIIVQVGPGVGVDISARFYAERLAELWKQPVVVENRPGGNGLIGTATFVRAHDDHTLLFSPAAPISVFPYLYDNLGYDPARDLVPVSLGAETFAALAASASSKIDKIDELEVRGRSKSRTRLTITLRWGRFQHCSEVFLKHYGLDMVQIPYLQDNLAVADLENGRLDIMLSTLASVLPALQSGKVRLLAVTNKTRAPIAPDVPTATEANCPELAYQGIVGFFGTSDMRAAVRDRISADVRRIAANPEFVAKFISIGQTARGSTAD